MKWLWIGILIGIAIIFGKLFPEKRRTKAKFSQKKPLSEVEQILYFKIQKAIGENYLVLPQVAFSRFLYTTGGNNKENWSKFSIARQKVIDYLICKKNFEIMAAIELDDSSHKAEKDKQRDNILTEAGIKIVRWNVKKMPDEQEIISTLTNKE